jgi:hypothetical protein
MASSCLLNSTHITNKKTHMEEKKPGFLFFLRLALATFPVSSQPIKKNVPAGAR